jgi:hypothetical protein
MIMLSRRTPPVRRCSLGKTTAFPAYICCLTPVFRLHILLMFVGMEYITLSNHALADEAINAAYSMCRTDPLLVHEQGVMAYNHGGCVPTYHGSVWDGC